MCSFTFFIFLKPVLKFHWSCQDRTHQKSYFIWKHLNFQWHFKCPHLQDGGFSILTCSSGCQYFMCKKPTRKLETTFLFLGPSTGRWETSSFSDPLWYADFSFLFEGFVIPMEICVFCRVWVANKISENMGNIDKHPTEVCTQQGWENNNHPDLKGLEGLWVVLWDNLLGTR